MKTRLTKLTALFVAGLALPLAACADDDDSNATPPAELGTIPEVAEEAGSFSTLLTAVQAAGLADELSGAGPFTVFAPTDDAFAALPEGALEGLLADTSALRDVLLHHVAAGELGSADVVGRTAVTMLDGQDADIVVNGSMVTIDGANISVTDIAASNGVIHVIDAVMLPPVEEPPPPGNIAEVATEAGNFTTLLAAVDAAGLTDALTGPGPITVFAPTDDAFAALPEGTVEALLADTDELRDVILHHVVDGRQRAAQVVAEERITTLLGPWVDVVVDGATVTVNGATLVATDVEASNGIIHVIDAVLVPPPKMADLVVATDALSTLEAAVVAAGLVDTLNGPGPFTVFAPTNDAFAALPAGTLDGLLADTGALTNVLTYHVVAGRVTADEVIGLSSVTTLQGAMAPIVVSDDGVAIAGQAVTRVDIQARNGVVHLIGGVMIPPAM